MPKHQHARGLNTTGSRTSIWLALAAALGLHAVLLILPLSLQTPISESKPAQIELQLVTFSPQSTIPLKPETSPEPIPEIEPSEAIIETRESIAEIEPGLDKPALQPPLDVDVKKNEIETLSEPERKRIASSVLSAQFITRESEADKLFGKPLEITGSGNRNDFSQPIHPDMISMLNQPMPDLPFAYTPGLVRFAYEPGVKGDLQRFWDVITPEFSWRTDNGTEFKCIWVLIVGGCGWK